MQSRCGVDGQQGSQIIIELKSASRSTSSVSPLRVASVISTRGRWFSRVRWFHLIPLACLLVGGAFVPRFLATSAVLAASVAVALGVFVLLIQLPLGFLVHRWRDRRIDGDARPRRQRRAPSSGI